MPFQGTFLQLGGVFGEFDSLWLDVARIHPVALYEEEHAGRLGGNLVSCFELANKGRKVESAKTESGATKKSTSCCHDCFLDCCLNKKESEDKSEIIRALKLPLASR